MGKNKLIQTDGCSEVKKKKPLVYITYIVCFCLVACYVVILAISTHPKVSIMYYLSYLDSVDSLTASTHREEFRKYMDESKVEYSLGKEEKLTFSQLPEDRYARIAKGWGVPSEEGIWCSQEGGFLFYKLNDFDKNKDLILKLKVFAFEGYEDVLVSANGMEIGKLSPQTGDIQITIPAKSFKDSYLYLFFQPEKKVKYEGDMSFCLTTASLNQ